MILLYGAGGIPGRGLIPKVGKDQIKNFSASSQKYPVIAVTSKLLSTGVDTKTTELIVLDKGIGSMTEFKQTIGRGTRIQEHYKVGDEEKSKTNFTIMDFRKNYLHFEDPDFDGTVEVVEGGNAPLPKKGKQKKKSERFRINGVLVEVVDKMVKYLNDDLSVKREENIETCAKNNILEHYATLDEFKAAWFASTDKQKTVKELLIDEKIYTALKEQVGGEADWYDLICYYGYGVSLPEKKDRIAKCKSYIETLSEEQQKVINILLDCYNDTDFYDLSKLSIFDVYKFRSFGYTRKTAVKALGGKDAFDNIIEDLEIIIFTEN